MSSEANGETLKALIDISPNKDGGILKKILSSGDESRGLPWNGDTVSVHYTGTLEDGTVFDSSLTRGSYFEFELGKGSVIKGWDIGVGTMYVGEKSTFTISSNFAYGDSGSPPKIPPKATLVFEIELFDFKAGSVNDKGTVRMRTKVPGDGYETPNDGSSIVAHIENLTTKEKRNDVHFIIGEGLEKDIPSGLEAAILKMKKGQISRVYCEASQGFTSGELAGKALEYEVTLLEFQRIKDSWQLDGLEKIEHGKIYKDKGTKMFKCGNFKGAVSKYDKVIEYLEHEISLKGEDEESRKALLTAARLNLALCHLKLENWNLVREQCDKVLETEPNNAKALFRRGEARFQINDVDSALLDYGKVFKLEPGNKVAFNKILQCKEVLKEQKAKEKATFANMFDKFAANDRRKEEEAKKRIQPVEISEWEHKKKNENDKDLMKVSGDVEMDIDLNKELSHEIES